VKYDLRKFSFSDRVTIVWNNVPDTVVKADSVNSFKNRLDWNDQEFKFNWKLKWKADTEGTGSRSNI